MSRADSTHRPARPATRAPSPRNIAIHTDTITLGALLKWAGVIETGGQAKQTITSGAIRVNGAVERRRGRQLGAGDFVQGPNGLRLVIVRASDATPPTDLSPRVP